jgi:CubicO group peptidase (beta-lactamase class C family)
MNKYYITLLLAFFITSIFSQKSKKDYTEAFNLVEVWLDAQKDFEKLPGITAIVVEDQEVLWSGAFGNANVQENIKTEVSTICSICSISKLFTSVAIMKLYDEGKLRLDDKISDLLPEYDLEQKYPESGPITIRTLLTHSSGLPREAGYPYWTGPDFPFPTTEQIDSKLSEQETLYPASTYFQYSNLALTLLGEIVEEVSGISYDSYVEQNILKPLELNDTRTILPEKLYGNQLAIGYNAINRKGEREKVNLFQANGIKPAAGYSSNVIDLGKFAAWQFRLRDSTLTEILKPSTLKYMQSVHWTNPDWKLTWGLGFRVYKGPNGSTWVGHGGSCPGYRSALELDLKNKRAFAIMINASGTNPRKYVNGIYEIMSKMKDKKDIETSGDKQSKKSLDEYKGYYNEMPWRSEVYISTWEGKLVSISLPSESPGKSMTFFKHIENDIFRRIRDNKELGETLVFERDKDGNIIRFKRHDNYSKKINR